MGVTNNFDDFELETVRPKLPESYLVPASVSDLNLTNNFALKMDAQEVKTFQGFRRLEDENGTSRSIDIPVPTTSPSHPRMAEKKYWKISFRIVLLPLVLLGIPAHLPLMKRKINTTSDWIKSLINLGNLAITTLSLAILIYSVALNVYVLKNIVELFDILVIKGQLDAKVFTNLVSLVQDLPIIIPMTFLWIWGYVFRDLILSFSRPSVSESFLQNPDLFQFPVPELPGRFKLVVMYVLIVFIHTLHIYLYSSRATADLDVLAFLTHFLDYFIGPVFSTLMLPIYATFCWACQRHYTILGHYVQTLISIRVAPDVTYFNRFKLAFKELSDRVQLLNRIFALYFSWIIANVLLSVYVEAWDLSNVFFGAMSTDEPEPISPGGNSTTGIHPDNTTTPTPDFPPPALVRALVGFLFVILLKMVLLLFTFWQAVGVNDMARGLNIWLNDLLTEPNANVSVSNYHAFRLLKFYVRSRMQQPRPALLRIPIMGCLPVLKARLTPALVDQY